jgi:hypothetical protein
MLKPVTISIEAVFEPFPTPAAIMITISVAGVNHYFASWALAGAAGRAKLSTPRAATASARIRMLFLPD